MKYKTFFLIDDGNNEGLFQLKVGGDKSKLINDIGATRKVRVVSNTSSNNGVEDYIYNDNIGIKNCITIGTRGNDYFSCYQDDYTVTIVRTLLLHTNKFELTQYISFYICALLRINKYKCAYGRVLSGERLMLEKISLPIDNNENPDWNCIEENGKIAYNKIYNSVNKNPLIKTKFQLQTENWKAFKISELFEVKKGKRLTAENIEQGQTPFISAIDGNNGVSNFISHKPIFEGNTITVNYDGNGVAEAYYHIKPYFALDSVNILNPRFKLNSYIAMFLNAIIKKEKYRFGYGRKWHKERMEVSQIKLPATSQGKPDWEFMENYIKSLLYSSSL